ncbi:hypothetical protein NCCP2716_15580 [Sporosarcina sp. NCCP-2716]|uniref:GGDEF domain-containing protein n=1 Tax=Sporosarcina sp. NCCP-2716 TaxID=2943679 RepID=UPI00203E6B5F|nr:GGDEF domain-containing protein [Sporosarcina sp. NCCP-2716]GKV69060.1 hypothetical protein NCCP2716_15580 [Sporosarcina sp. NCCP-2716]
MNTRTAPWQRLQLPAAAVVWLVTASVLLGFQTETRLITMTILLAGCAVLFFSVADRTAFFLYILFTLVTVFYFLYLAFAEGWSPGEQAAGIGLHFLFLLHLFALYSLAKYVFSYRKENAALKERVEELREFISEQGVLTKREFEKQATLVLSAMARHEESGYFLKADLSELRRSARKQAVLASSAAIYGTLRKQYDLVGQWDGTTLVVVLQHVGEEGFAVVEGRLQEAMARQLEPDALERIRWETRRIDGQRSIGELLVIA